MMDGADPRGTSRLVSDVLSSITNLLRQEVDLARAEVDQNIKRAGIGIGFIAVALLLALVALSVLSSAAIAALVMAGLGQIWATLAVGLGLIAIAAVLVAIGVKRLKLSSLAPSRAGRSLRRNAAALKEAYHDQ